MYINRRSFIKSSSILVGGIVLQGSQVYKMPDNAIENIREIVSGFGIYNEKGGTIGWYVQDDVVVVIDSQFPDSAKNFKNALNTKSSRNINYLFNTHHHRDHTLGNYYIKGFSENIIAHTNCPRLQIKQNKGEKTESQVVTANITFDSKLRITLPNENLNSMHFGQAHTGGDIVVHFENNNIAHLGDLVFNNVIPFIDKEGECSVKNWALVLEKVLSYFDASTRFIFGHADSNKNVVGSKNDILKMKNYLEGLYSYTYNELAIGKSVAEIENSNKVPGFENVKELWDGARKMNLKATAEQIKTDNK